MLQSAEVLIQLLANGLANACVMALMATGFALIYNTTRIFHLAHGAVYVVSAYTFYMATERLFWPQLLAAILALVVAALLGCAIEFLAYAPLYRKRASAAICLLTSFGLYVALINTIALLFGNEVRVFPATQHASISFGPVLLSGVQLLEVVTSLLVLTPVMIMLRKSQWGRIVRAVRDNPTLAETIGVNLIVVRLLVFAVGSALAGIAAVLSVLDTGTDPQVGLPVLLIATVAVIVGGIGTFGGSILGSILVAVLQSMAIWRISPKWSQAITFGILILFMIFRPSGLLGFRGRLEEAMP
jgi:branched-chain amino acid transport system permease protein